MNELLMGDEAVALGALHAGIAGAFGYPGTPATEILESIQARVRAGETDISARWSANEKVAYEEALGASYAGHRALVSMKHVGLNVAADPFMSSALTGANGGLVLAVADDPGMHSSQNEQDSRYFGQFAQIPVLEPSNQQEAYDMTREAFETSECLHIPVMIRLVTRLSHSRANVKTAPPVDATPLPRAKDWREWTLLPVNARKRFSRLLDLQEVLGEYAHDSTFNSLTLNGPKGILVTGLAYNYVREAIGSDNSYSILKIGAYPVPMGKIRELVDHCKEVLLVEEGYPFVEKQLAGLMGLPGKHIRGKLDGALPRQGEMTTDLVRDALGLPMRDLHPAEESVPGRPPQLCGGCPHCDTYKLLTDALADGDQPYYFGDIGCYTLAALPPYNAMETCVDMGASIGMAIGAAKVGEHPVVATIGDSTFLHSGMSALVGAAHDDINMTVIVLDNALVAMTGGQEAMATGDDMIRVIKGLGVNEDHVVYLEPLPKLYDQNVELFRKELAHCGLSVIVACRPCIHAKKKAAAPVAASA